MTKKKIIIISLLIGMVSGVVVGYFLPRHQTLPTKKEEVEIANRIDSIVLKRDSIIEVKMVWRDKVITIEKERITEKNKIKELPLDSGIIWLSNKLKDYEKN